MFPHDGECISSICVCKPLPHAWNLVNGHVVDLLAEFYNWRFGSEYLHEPLKVYTLEDMRVGGVPANFSIVQKVWMEQHQREPESMAATCQHVFKGSHRQASFRAAALNHEDLICKKFGAPPLHHAPSRTSSGAVSTIISSV